MHSTIKLFVLAAIIGMPWSVLADDDFHGIVESRPGGLTGTWTIGGRSIEVTESTELEEDNGPAVVGACVSVDFEGTRVEEIETEQDSDCVTR